MRPEQSRRTWRKDPKYALVRRFGSVAPIVVPALARLRGAAVTKRELDHGGDFHKLHLPQPDGGENEDRAVAVHLRAVAQGGRIA